MELFVAYEPINNIGAFNSVSEISIFDLNHPTCSPILMKFQEFFQKLNLSL